MRSTRYDLVLVNRVLDEDGSSGLELIRALKHDPALADVPVMLVSNHADAQEAAFDLGASPGFGKASLHSDATLAHQGSAGSMIKAGSGCLIWNSRGQ